MKSAIANRLYNFAMNYLVLAFIILVAWLLTLACTGKFPTRFYANFQAYDQYWPVLGIVGLIGSATVTTFTQDNITVLRHIVVLASGLVTVGMVVMIII